MFKVRIFHKNKVVNLIRNFEAVLKSCPGKISSTIMLHGFKKKDLIEAAKYINDPSRVIMDTNSLQYAIKGSPLLSPNIFLFY